MELVGTTFHKTEPNASKAKQKLASFNLKECRVAALYDQDEIEDLRRKVKLSSFKKEEDRFRKSQKDMETCLRRLIRENEKIKQQLEKEMMKNRKLMSTNRGRDKTDYNNRDKDLSKILPHQEEFKDGMLSGFKTEIEELEGEVGETNFDHDSKAVTTNMNAKPVKLHEFENTFDMSFDFLNCSTNGNNNALSSTRMSIDKKRRESRRQTIFELMEENTTFRKKLEAEKRKSTFYEKQDLTQGLENKINEITIENDSRYHFIEGNKTFISNIKYKYKILK